MVHGLLLCAPLYQQPSSSDQIDDFCFAISRLAEANSPLRDDTWRNFQAWIWSNPEGWWIEALSGSGPLDSASLVQHAEC